jgi:LmbE family N-acetylglucosaminyl deacetylase
LHETVPPNQHKRALSDLLRYLLTLCCHEIPDSELSRSALVFSPHPDDESLACGGTIIKKKRAGATIKLVHMTDGGGSHSYDLIPTQDLRAIRKAESINAARVLDVDHTYFLDFKDGTLAKNIGPAAERVLTILRQEDPEEVFVPHFREPIREAADHVAATQIVMAALDSYRKKVTVWEYPVWFWLHWPWVGLRSGCPPIKMRQIAKNTAWSLVGSRAFLDLSHCLNISDAIEQKSAAIAEHKSQMTRLIPQSRWTTLADVSYGHFLNTFYYHHEFFRRSIVG